MSRVDRGTLWRPPYPSSTGRGTVETLTLHLAPLTEQHLKRLHELRTDTSVQHLVIADPVEDDAWEEPVTTMLQQNTHLQRLTLRNALPAGPAGDTLLNSLACHVSIAHVEIVGIRSADVRRLAALLTTPRTGALSSVSLAGVETLPRPAANAIVALIAAGCLDALTLQFDLDDAQLRLLLHATQLHRHTCLIVNPPPWWAPKRTARAACIVQAETDYFRAGLDLVHGFAPPRSSRLHHASAAEASCIRLIEDARAFCEQWDGKFSPSAQHDSMPPLPHELSESALAFERRAAALRQRFDRLADVPAAFKVTLRDLRHRCSDVRRQARQVSKHDGAFKLARSHFQQMS